MTISFFNNGTSGKVFVLENLLCLKYLHNRGFDVSRVSVDEPILDDIWHILFESVRWNSIEIKPPPELEGLDEEDEERYYIEDYLGRDHFMVDIEIKELRELAGRIRPKHYRELQDILKKVCAAKDEDYEELTWELIREMKWLVQDGKIVGLTLHFVDIRSDWEDPYYTGVYFKAFLKFWDRLQELKAEVAQNVRINNNRDTARLYRLGKGAERVIDQRKANRPVQPDNFSQRIA